MEALTSYISSGIVHKGRVLLEEGLDLEEGSKSLMGLRCKVHEVTNTREVFKITSAKTSIDIKVLHIGESPAAICNIVSTRVVR